ncbi:MAG: hypothetical protein Q4F42_05125 [Rikenellaceae bacterium]|nr:hypothetical protein [Rikenellaceae bacterium]
MKKLIFILATMLPLLFVACSNKDETTPQNEIVGLWELSKKYIPEDNRWYYAEENIDELHEVEFYDDGSGQFNNYYKSDIATIPFYWTVTDKQLRLVLGEGSDSYEAYWLESLSSNEMVLKDANDATSYYKRRK